MNDFPEADWTVFRTIRELALERFCARILEEMDAVRSDTSRSHHERYGAIFQLMRDRDRDVARAFDNPRRSAMLIQLASIHALDLLQPEELARFTPETRARIEFVTKECERKSDSL